MKMTLFFSFFALATIVGIAYANNPNNCQKPDPNRKACFDPASFTVDCSLVMVNPDQCTGSKQYIINLFPDGAVGDPLSGRWTTNQSADCYKYANCQINPITNSCQNMLGYGSWFQKPKTIIDGTRFCPPPGGGGSPGGGGA